MENLKDLTIEGVNLYLNINLEKYTTIKLAKNGDIAIVENEKALTELLSFLYKIKYQYHVVGWGANQVLLTTKNILFIKLKFPFSKENISEDKSEFNLPASTPLNQLTSLAIKYGFSGWEYFTGIPASLGGAVAMNAGTSLGEICELVKSVKIMKKDGTTFLRELSASDFSYRKNHFLNDGDIITEVTLIHYGIDKKISKKIQEYLDYRNKTQPLTTKNCGSVFKNINKNIRAGRTIDIIGLKGFGTQSIAVSMKHGNFIENQNKASVEEFEQIIQLLSKEIERFSGLEFELEVKLY